MIPFHSSWSLGQGHKPRDINLCSVTVWLLKHIVFQKFISIDTSFKFIKIFCSQVHSSVWRPEFSIMWCPSGAIYLLSKTGSLPGIWAHQSTRLASQKPQASSCLSLPRAGVRHPHTPMLAQVTDTSLTGLSRPAPLFFFFSSLTQLRSCLYEIAFRQIFGA